MNALDDTLRLIESWRLHRENKRLREDFALVIRSRIPVTDLLYYNRALCERRIAECDEQLKKRPSDPALIHARRAYARLAARYDGKIWRLECSMYR